MIFLLLLLFSCMIYGQKSFVIYPVVNCIGEPFLENHALENKYKEIPYSWAGNTNDSCPRIHQLLLHEQVNIVETKGQQVKIEIPNILCIDKEGNNKNQFWTLSSYLLKEDDVKNYQELLSYLPEQIHVHDSIDYSNKTTITLAFPFFDKQSHTLYSAGTRFAIIKLYDKTVECAVFDPQQQAFKSKHIPKYLIIDSYKASDQERRDLMVELLRLWVHNPTGHIPFVWGGVSLTEFIPLKKFEKITLGQGEDCKEVWQRKDQAYPCAGFDASGLILRAAQMSGIPYFAKNTKTAAAVLQKINRYDRIQEGDLLIVPGGIFVISNLKEHNLIAAIGYQFGYGAVVELSIHELFADIRTLEELVEKYFHQTPLTSKLSNNTFENWGLYKLF